MTALAQRITETPMAPYMALMRDMTREEKEVVIAFLVDLMDEKKPARKVPVEFKKLRLSPTLRWMRLQSSTLPKWDPIAAWNRLTDAQREEASTKLHLTPEDMDERTFAIIEKHLKNRLTLPVS